MLQILNRWDSGGTQYTSLNHRKQESTSSNFQPVFFKNNRSVAALARLSRQISTSPATTLFGIVKCVAYRQACDITLPKKIKLREIWRLVFERTGVFRQKFGLVSPFGDFSPKRK
jgi:hypothetical protein